MTKDLRSYLSIAALALAPGLFAACGGDTVSSQDGAECGDGVVDGRETCDDGNETAMDGCSVTCRVETGWACDSGEPTGCDEICGDGRTVGGEARAGGCDDDNTADGDGCNASCEVESGWACAGEPSECGDPDECATGPCRNGGICTEQSGSFSCDCSQTGYTGPTCETAVDTLPCDIEEALTTSCARVGCHSTATHYANLDLSSLDNIAARLVDVPATFGDIDCTIPGQPFMACVEPPSDCPPGQLLIDSRDPENSRMLVELRGEQGNCGGPMPLPPGDSASSGWSDERKACIEAWIYSLAGGQ